MSDERVLTASERALCSFKDITEISFDELENVMTLVVGNTVVAEYEVKGLKKAIKNFYCLLLIQFPYRT